MGNLRQKYTDEEWERLENHILFLKQIEINQRKQDRFPCDDEQKKNKKKKK